MAYLGYSQITVSSSVVLGSDQTVPQEATFVELQAETNPVRYTMDATTVPTQTSGAILATGKKPKLFTIGDFLRLKCVRGAGSDALLNVHYFNPHFFPPVGNYVIDDEDNLVIDDNSAYVVT